MSWNYRVVQYVAGNEVRFQIHEVYYDEADMVEHWTANPVCPSGESLEELKSDCDHYLQAFALPILTEITDGDGVIKLIEWKVK